MDSISAVHSNYSQFAHDLTPIYGLCHSRKTINRALILHKGDSSEEREEEDKGEKENPLLLDHRRSSFRRPNTPGFCWIFKRMPEFFPTSTGCGNSS
ncbi:hypothetical protein MA16_Dca011713 [Dendrobium catenatum]|uniref:Uncharacterized protein n=1 Tax=Dendrobium catenatum TaxID=906689 RepID=A0A2I0WY49_9ASPA|nr:hypothetical protein MA16_Dca011713 [Dendrobium catenatum]